MADKTDIEVEQMSDDEEEQTKRRMYDADGRDDAA